MKKILFTLIGILLFPPLVFGDLTSNNYSIDLEKDSSQALTYSTNDMGIISTDNRSFSVWFKVESNPTSGNINIIIGHQDSLANYRVGIYNNSGTMQVIAIRNNAGNYDNSTYNIDLNDSNWHNILYTRNGSDISVYLDGNDIITLSSSFTSSSNGGTGINIGTYYDNNTDLVQTFDGLIDDARLWERELSSSEATSLYNNPCIFDNGSNLVGWWVLENNLTDLSGNGYTLTNHNSAIFSSSFPYVCTSASQMIPPIFIKAFWW